MAKGYWIAHVDISDLEAYKKYVEANAIPFAKYGARFIVRGGNCEVVEGALRSKNVVIEFESYEQALACYRSAEYKQAKSLRDNVSTGDVAIVEGYDGPQP